MSRPAVRFVPRGIESLPPPRFKRSWLHANSDNAVCHPTLGVSQFAHTGQSSIAADHRGDHFILSAGQSVAAFPNQAHVGSPGWSLDAGRSLLAARTLNSGLTARSLD